MVFFYVKIRERYTTRGGALVTSQNNTVYEITGITNVIKTGVALIDYTCFLWTIKSTARYGRDIDSKIKQVQTV